MMTALVIGGSPRQSGHGNGRRTACILSDDVMGGSPPQALLFLDMSFTY